MRSIVTAFLLLGAARAAAQCNFPPAERDRSSLPADGDVNVPTSVLIRVVYAQGSYAEKQCGQRPPAPTVRPAAGDAGAPDGGVAQVAGQWVRGTDDDPHAATIWLFHPAQPLAANTTFELSDTFPASCPCVNGSCAPTAEAVFARFTTGAGPDTTKPTFGGLVGSSCQHQTCAAGDTGCCGPFDHFTYAFYDKRDEADDHLVGVHLYLRADGAQYDFTHPVGPSIGGVTRFTDPVDSIVAFALDQTLTPGTWHAIARAYDTSGNEDGNMVEVTFKYPIKDDPLCTIYDLGMPDSDDGMLAPLYDLSGAADMASGSAPGGCGCTVGGRARAAGGGAAVAALLALGTMAVAVSGRRRARRRSRRAARGETP